VIVAAGRGGRFRLFEKFGNLPLVYVFSKIEKVKLPPLKLWILIFKKIINKCDAFDITSKNAILIVFI
jgi:hypothetical protein